MNRRWIMIAFAVSVALNLFFNGARSVAEARVAAAATTHGAEA